MKPRKTAKRTAHHLTAAYAALFAERWSALPPLVRVSFADNLVRYALNCEKRLYYCGDPVMQQLIEDTLPRRHRVHEKFKEAAHILRDLAVSLTY